MFALRAAKQTQDSAYRNLEPVGAVIQFVGNFVKSFLQKERIQKKLALCGAARDKIRGASLLEVGIQIGGRNGLVPTSGPFFDSWFVLTVDLHARHLPKQYSKRGVFERAQHTGNVAQRKSLGAPFGEGARGLALEIDNHEIGPGEEHLSEVVIAMVPDTFGGARLVINRLQTPGYSGLEGDEFPNAFRQRTAERVHFAAQQAERGVRLLDSDRRTAVCRRLR